jgi:hypothetical protein
MLEIIIINALVQLALVITQQVNPALITYKHAARYAVINTVALLVTTHFFTVDLIILLVVANAGYVFLATYPLILKEQQA